MLIKKVYNVCVEIYTKIFQLQVSILKTISEFYDNINKVLFFDVFCEICTNPKFRGIKLDSIKLYASVFSPSYLDDCVVAW